ncbi:hypothetical protein Fleli_2938 [Bernardetia litoralis DSM 6794]|uniref:Uncharacterized protein n=1 Tax=Bernardetia litoralis (strain ATCC 23117 / DSM 6794 / NBRC 15988 / NCIMB 1366 / Fx l1 / Sio-4) TaxID=880071 RepID=I4AMV0_BERLS|nr:DUF4221 family protein [Bernardetia litoralis]AFM05285.1 hypothetical protein Fleli_2938 [Bernardetia litoralis DSM 6794]
MKYTFLFLLIFAFSCTSSQKQETPQMTKNFNEMSLEEILNVPIIFSDKEYTLEKSTEIDIPIDSVSQNWSAYPIYHDADTAQYYVQGNEAINSIDFYDLEKKQLHKRVKFERTGNKIISSTRKIFIKNADSIYIFEGKYGRINLVNMKGDILQRYDIPKRYIHDISANMSSNFYTNGQETYFLVNIFSGLELNDINQASIGNKKMIGMFNMNEGEIKFIEPKASKFITNNKIPATALMFSTFFSKKNIVQQSDLIGIVSSSINKEQYKYSVLRRKGFDKEKLKEMKRESNGINYDSHFLILPNEKNNLFYSVILEGIEEKDLGGNPNSYDDKPITIVIADENFHHAGEITLPKDTHYRNIMMTRDGLLVSNANPKNPNNDESVLSFTLYKPKKIK